MKIQQIISRIRNQGIHLPTFQRGYVWKPETAAQLMDSLYREYPIGIITTWETDHGQLIVDGQQRIASIYACCTGNIPPTHLDQENQPATDLHFNIAKETFKFPSQRDLKNPLWLNVSQIIKESTDWRQRVRKSPSHSEELEDQYADRIINIRNIITREIPTADVGINRSPEEVVNIFVRLNRQGKTVQRADLDMAMISIPWKSAKGSIQAEKKKWETTPLKKAMKEDVILRTMTAIHTGGYPKDGLANASQEDLEKAFSKTAAANETIFKSLTKRLAITDQRAIPNLATFPIIARYLSNHAGKFPTAADEAKALAYYLISTAWHLYHGSTNTQIDADVKLADKPDPWTALHDSARTRIGEPTAEPVRFEFKRRGGRFFVITHVLQKQPQVRDLLTNHPIREYPAEELEQHHIFPRIHLQTRGTHQEKLESIANIALITGTSNRTLADRPPEEYLAEIDNDGGTMLKAHCIPRDRELWKIENYETFLEQRRKLMAEATNNLITNLRQGRFN